MLEKTRIPRATNLPPLTDEQVIQVGSLLALTLDKLDQEETSLASIAQVICLLLIEFGDDEVDSNVAAVLVSRQLEASFVRDYWRGGLHESRLKTLMRAVITARSLIRKGLINEESRKLANQAIDKTIEEDKPKNQPPTDWRFW